jgi:hypothetical protein
MLGRCYDSASYLNLLRPLKNHSCRASIILTPASKSSRPNMSSLLTETSLSPAARHGPQRKGSAVIRPAALTLASGASALALIGCGGSSATSHHTVSPRPPAQRYVSALNAERLIGDRISGQRHQPVSVSCPSTVPLSAGHRFLCTATLPHRQTVLLLVTETDGQGRLRFQPARRGP